MARQRLRIEFSGVSYHVAAMMPEVNLGLLVLDPAIVPYACWTERHLAKMACLEKRTSLYAGGLEPSNQAFKHSECPKPRVAK